MVATGYRRQWWTVTDDWEQVEGMKQSPSDLSEAYPDSLEGVLIDGTQELIIALDESLSISLDDSEVFSDESSDSSAESLHVESKGCLSLAAEGDQEECLSEAAVNDEDRDSPEALNLVSSMKIKENIQELANAAGSKALEASVLVSSLVKEGFHLGLSKIVEQLETLEAVVEQMNQPAVDHPTVSRQSVVTLEQQLLVPPASSPLLPVGFDELTTVSSMGDTYVEHVRPAVHIRGQPAHGPKVIFEFAEKSLVQSIKGKSYRRTKKTPDGPSQTKSGAPHGRVQVVRVRKARGRTLVRVVSPKDRSRSKSRQKTAETKNDKGTGEPQMSAQAATAITRRKDAVQHTSEVKKGLAPAGVASALKSSLRQQTSLNEVKMMGTHHLDGGGGFYKVEGSNSSLTTQMKNISRSQKNNKPNLSDRHSMFGRNIRLQRAMAKGQ